MKENKRKIADSFESLSKAIIQHLFRDSSAHISQTRSNKDGGYDIVVEYQDEQKIEKAFFECKLRNSNLNLRDIAANVIIAFNHGAIALAAVTNHDFTQQTGEELLDFYQNTVLNIKIITGEDVKSIADGCGISIVPELESYFNAKKTNRKDDFRVLKLNLNENILEQIFKCKFSKKRTIDILLSEIFKQDINEISSLLSERQLVVVQGYIGVGKDEVITVSLEGINQQKIIIDAAFYETKDLVVLNILAQIWGIPNIKIFSCFSEKEIQAITESIDGKVNSEETTMILNALLNSNYMNGRTTAQQNVLLCEYIMNLLSLHRSNINYVFYIKKLQFASKEVYDFLIYFAKHLAMTSIGCIISYQKPEYKIQEGRNLLEVLKHIDTYHQYVIKPLKFSVAQSYIEQIYPGISSYIAQLIVKKVGTRFYNLRALLKSIIPNNLTMPYDSKIITQKLTAINPNDIPNQLEIILPQYKNNYPFLFKALFIFKCKIPIELSSFLNVSEEEFDVLENAGILEYRHEYIITQNEFIHDWVMSAYISKSISIQKFARELLEYFDKFSIECNVERIILYEIVGRWKDALNLLDSNIKLLEHNKQYTSLRKGLHVAVEISAKTNDYIKQASYLISLLKVLTIQKEIVSPEAEKNLLLLEVCTQHTNIPIEYIYALDFYKLKRSFKLGEYLNDNDKSKQKGYLYYSACLTGKISDNTGDWLGQICGCYALMVKETKGNEQALEIFENSLSVFPESFELRREYYSHIACMELYNAPLKAYDCYTKILNMFESEVQDSAALPFHEYGDVAMSQLMASKLEHALELANNAIDINQSNGINDEEGRCLNILGCIQWCMGDLSGAKKSFFEATSIMRASGYLHYSWRSQLNLLQILRQTDTPFDAHKEMLEKTYNDFKYLLYDKINSLASLPLESFRETREYHALLVLGELWFTHGEKNVANKLCNDFKLGEHKSQYQKDLQCLLSGNYKFMNSPYIKDNFIYFVG